MKNFMQISRGGRVLCIMHNGICKAKYYTEKMKMKKYEESIKMQYIK